MSAGVEIARARDVVRIDEMQRRLLRHELLLEATVARIRAALERGRKEDLVEIEEVLTRAIAAGPPDLPKPSMNGVDVEELKELHVRYRIFIEELAVSGVATSGTQVSIRARELLGWPRETRTR